MSTNIQPAANLVTTFGQHQCAPKLLVAFAALIFIFNGLFCGPKASANDKDPTAHFIVVVGAAGANEFEQTFLESSQNVIAAASESGAKTIVIGSDETSSISDDDDSVKLVDDRARLQHALKQIDKNASSLWVVMFGHGTFHQNVAKFNLQGPDVSADEVKQWLAPVKCPTVLVNCSSASAPFINALSGPNRVIVTATKSGNEQNYARFGKFFAAALQATDSDLDHDGETSVLEAFLKASSDVERFYEGEGRITTEHALIDDNGDERGTRANVFQGIRNKSKANKDKIDGNLAKRMTLSKPKTSLPFTKEELQKRDEIEKALNKLADLPIDKRLGQSEPHLLELAKLYSTAEERLAETDSK